MTTITIHVATQTPADLAAQLAPLGEWKSASTVDSGRATPMLGVFEDSDLIGVLLAALGCREPGERAKITFADAEVTLIFPDDDQTPDPTEAELRHQKRARDDAARFANYRREACRPQPPSPRFW